MTRRVRRSADDFYGIMQSFEEQGLVHGRPLSLTPLFAGSFTADPVSGGPTGGGCGGVCTPGKPSCASRHDPEFAPAVRDFKEMYCTTYAPGRAQSCTRWRVLASDPHWGWLRCFAWPSH